MRFLAKGELLAVLGEARRARERDWLMYLVGYWHGLRASEVVHIMPVDVAGGFLRVARLKGSDVTVQPLIEDAEPLLNERGPLETLARNTPSVSRLFPFSRVHYYRLFRKYAKKAGLAAHLWHPHTLKHSIAMHSIEIAGIQNVQKYLGHKSMASTGEYLKVTDAQAAAAIARAARS